MCGEWNALQAFFSLMDCPDAYYIHCICSLFAIGFSCNIKRVDSYPPVLSNLSSVNQCISQMI